MASRVTQKDIAEKVGVNQKTVSMAFRSPERLAPPTLQRILAAANQMGYRPNTGARAIRTGRFDNVMLLASDREWRGNIPSQVLYGIHDRLHENNLSLSLARMSDRELTDESVVPRALFDHAADGAIINIDVMIPQRMIQLLDKFRLPAVWLNTRQPHNCVHPDDHGAGRDAARKLLELGHRHIVYVDFFKFVRDEVRHYSKDDRLSGYEETMQAAGLEPRYILPDADLPVSDRTRYIAEQLEHMPEVTAAITYSGGEATSVMRAVEIELDGRVPQSFSIITFAGHAVPYSGLEITAYVVPEHELGYRTADRLLRLIEDPTPQPAEALPFKFRPGETCARPPV